MSKTPALNTLPEIPGEIKQAGPDGRLLLFVGAGASMLLGLPSWSQLSTLLLEDLQKENKLNYSDIAQLRDLDPKKKLSISSIILKDDLLFNELIKKHLDIKKNDSSIFDYINKIGCPCVTTNYDIHLSPVDYSVKEDGSEIPKEPTRLIFPAELLAGKIDTPGVVAHLHGCINKPSSMIVTTKQYLEHYENKFVQTFLKEIFQNKTVLFVGYGLEETEILEHILRRGSVSFPGDRGGKLIVRQAFALMGFFSSEESLYKHLYRYYRESFGVYLIGFRKDENNYKQLELIMQNWSNVIEISPTPLVDDLMFMEEVLENA